MGADFTESQVAQILSWSAAGETPQSILARAADENAAGAPLSPWPESAEADIEQVLHDHSDRRVALFARRLLTHTGLAGLSARASQASAAIDRIHALSRQIARADAEFDQLVGAGAYRVAPFLTETELDNANAVFTETFAGSVRNKDGSRAIILARPSGERYRVETSALVVGNALLVRAQALSKHTNALKLIRARECELLAKITGAANVRDLMEEPHFD
jgi:hypothetical protein